MPPPTGQPPAHRRRVLELRCSRPPALAPSLYGQSRPLLMETRRGVGRCPSPAQPAGANVEVVRSHERCPTSSRWKRKTAMGSKRRCPLGRRYEARMPVSAQRRTVSGLTAQSSATSRTVIVTTIPVLPVLLYLGRGDSPRGGDDYSRGKSWSRKSDLSRRPRVLPRFLRSLVQLGPALTPVPYRPSR